MFNEELDDHASDWVTYTQEVLMVKLHNKVREGPYHDKYMCGGLSRMCFVYHVGHHRLCAGLVMWATVVVIVYTQAT